MFQDTLGLVHWDVQLTRKLVDAHTVQNAQTHCLGPLTRDVGHLGNHRMEICAWVFVVTLNKLFGPAQRLPSLFTKHMGIVNQDAWFLLREVNCRPLVALFW